MSSDSDHSTAQGILAAYDDRPPIPSSDNGLDQLPIFVYGTLRHGQDNYWLLRGRTLAETPATIARMQMFSVGAYPVLIEKNDDDALVQGQLMLLHPQFYTDLLASMDQLEGYRAGDETSLFRRVERCVRTVSGRETRAWIYLINPAYLPTMQCLYIPHGDWCRYRTDLVRDLKFARLTLDRSYKERS